MTQTELVDAIYSEMAEFGFLTSYIYGDGIEEININSWRDIEVQYSDGRNENLTEDISIRRNTRSPSSVVCSTPPAWCWTTPVLWSRDT